MTGLRKPRHPILPPAEIKRRSRKLMAAGLPMAPLPQRLPDDADQPPRWWTTVAAVIVGVMRRIWPRAFGPPR